jgi:hypothetical protein
MKCKRIPGFEKEYVVSRDGRVFRKLKDGHREISPATNDAGYRTVVLYKNSKPHFKYIHILVADAWNENPDGKGIVNHKNGDKTDDSADNLEFADESENTQHAYDKGLATGPEGEDNGKSKLTNTQVKSIRKSNKSGVKLASLYGVTPAAISLIRNKRRW